jgi:hypothetical protein
MLAIVGDQFGEAGEDLCGPVLSVSGNEDVLNRAAEVLSGPSKLVTTPGGELLCL